MAAAKLHVVETTFINTWVENGVYDLRVTREVSAQMARHRVSLVDVNHILGTGRVVRSDMMESRGLWNVRGYTADNVRLEVVITVVSTSAEVELLRIESVQRR